MTYYNRQSPRRTAEKRASFLAVPRNAEAIAYVLAADQQKRDGTDTFAGSLAQSYATWGELTERQVDAALKSRDREATWAAERAARPASTSAHVGTVGQKLTITVTVVFTKQTFSRYGTSTLVAMTDADGNALRTFNSGAFGGFAKKGDVVTITGTVKAHEVYRDEAQTMLTRVAVVATRARDDNADEYDLAEREMVAA